MKEKKNEGNYFNPLPRKEGDKSIVPLCALSTHFNPLPRKEGDLKRGCCVIRAFWISIHSLVKRETFLTSLPFLSYFDFNPLPRKEGDPSRTDLHRAVGDFNPLPRKEGDQKRNDHGDCQKRFQSTPS